jgi:hypothetical protein
MLRELLEKYHPQERHIISAEETKLVKETLHISEMDILALRNLRDFTVMFLTQETTKATENIIKNWDRMSAITYVIDTEILEKGGEV